ncbi:Genetic suppressor element 1, partial [Ophiophagus hannah]
MLQLTSYPCFTRPLKNAPYDLIPRRAGSSLPAAFSCNLWAQFCNLSESDPGRSYTQCPDFFPPLPPWCKLHPTECFAAKVTVVITATLNVRTAASSLPPLFSLALGGTASSQALGRENIRRQRSYRPVESLSKAERIVGLRSLGQPLSEGDFHPCTKTHNNHTQQQFAIPPSGLQLRKRKKAEKERKTKKVRKRQREKEKETEEEREKEKETKNERERQKERGREGEIGKEEEGRRRKKERK